ncbi:MAG: hypothetical protein HYW05_03080 [Candidatus Diapherotrites archaeon]|nr:hypothetical protein [Candidatus Diapherotrites archaeon]
MLITTSRNAGAMTRQFAKGLSLSLPDAEYVSRNGKSVDALVADARYSGRKRLLIAHDSDGKPAMIFCIGISESSWDYIFSAGISLQKQRDNKSGDEIPSLRLQIKSAKMKKFIKALGIGNEGDSEFILREQDSSIGFYSGKREIGPRFRILGIEYEKKP